MNYVLNNDLDVLFCCMKIIIHIPITQFERPLALDVAKYSYEICILRHGVKYRALVRQQRLRRVELLDESPVQHHDSVVVENGVESVGDGQNSAVGKLLPDRGLDEVVRLQVDGRRRLVQYEHLRLPVENSPVPVC